MTEVFEVMLKEIDEDKPNEQGVRMQKKTSLIVGASGDIFTLTIERGDTLNLPTNVVTTPWYPMEDEIKEGENK